MTYAKTVDRWPRVGRGRMRPQISRRGEQITVCLRPVRSPAPDFSPQPFLVFGFGSTLILKGGLTHGKSQTQILYP